jgi:hypothetical protein
MFIRVISTQGIVFCHLMAKLPQVITVQELYLTMEIYNFMIIYIQVESLYVKTIYLIQTLIC